MHYQRAYLTRRYGCQVVRRFIVSGKVQGVFFRASTQAQAKRFDLTGYAMNRADGCVDVVACGDSTKLQQFGELFALVLTKVARETQYWN